MPTFDGDNLMIILDSGVTGVDAEVDLYSDWKEWQRVSDNSKYPPAFRTIGGDPLTPGIDAGAYFFIRNDLGWRIRPPEEDTTIYLTKSLAPEDSSLPILIPTVGNYRVLILGLQPITQSVDTLLGLQQQTIADISTIPDDLLDAVDGVESSLTVRQALRVIVAALGGKLSGAETSTVSIRDTNDTKDRIVATVDSSGNRTAVTLDAT